MNFEALNSAAAPLHRHFSDAAPVSRRRSKRVFDDDYFADCLIALARSGGATSCSSTSTVDAKPTCGEDFSSRRDLRRHKATQPPTADDGRKASNSTSTASSYCTSGSHRSHRCSICGKIFATGQALGGHKRKHYDGVVSRNSGLKRSVNSSDGGIVSSTKIAVDMAPIVRGLVLKLPLRPS